MAGSKEQWPYELLGAHPSECQEDCCNGGMWTFYTHLADEYGRYVPFGDYMIDALERRIAMDKKWRELSETERHLHTEAELSLAQQKKDEIALTEVLTEKEHYLTHKEEKDAADTRMRIGFGKQTVPDTIKGGKLPIGHSKLKL